MNNSTIIQIKNLKKDFPIGKGFFTALQNINISIKTGEFLGLIGPSGSGKTTLLNIIGSLDICTEGEVTVLDKNVGTLSQIEAANFKKLVSWIYFSNL